MAGAGPPSTSFLPVGGKDVDGGAKPRHDDKDGECQWDDLTQRHHALASRHIARQHGHGTSRQPQLRHVLTGKQ